jgi:hypothetical protein
MPRKVVVVIRRRGRKRGLGAACYHSYIQKSHEYWVWRVEWLYKLDAEMRTKKEAERSQIEASRKIDEQRQREREEEKKLREEIIPDIICGRRKIDRGTYAYAGTTGHRMFKFLSSLAREEEKKDGREMGMRLWWFEDILEDYEFWDFDHSPRKRKW